MSAVSATKQISRPPPRIAELWRTSFRRPASVWFFTVYPRGRAESKRSRTRDRPDNSSSRPFTQPSSLVFDPRIYIHIQHIDDQIDQHVAGGGEQNSALDHRIIPPQHGINDQTP